MSWLNTSEEGLCSNRKSRIIAQRTYVTDGGAPSDLLRVGLPVLFPRATLLLAKIWLSYVFDLLQARDGTNGLVPLMYALGPSSRPWRLHCAGRNSDVNYGWGESFRHFVAGFPFGFKCMGSFGFST